MALPCLVCFGWTSSWISFFSLPWSCLASPSLASIFSSPLLLSILPSYNFPFSSLVASLQVEAFSNRVFSRLLSSSITLPFFSRLGRIRYTALGEVVRCRGRGEVNLSPTRVLTLRPRVGGFYVFGRLWEAQFLVFCVSGRLWEAKCVVFYVSGRLWEAKCFVFYVSGSSKRR